MFVLAGFPPIILGFASLVALRLIYQNRNQVANDNLVLVITIAAWTMVFIGLSMLFSPIGMILVLLILAMVVAKYREGERRALLWTLSVAAERGLPLAASARAFASRRCDEIARRAWRLADILDEGVPLHDALKKTGNRLPPDAAMMVGLGAAPQVTAEALRASADSGALSDDAWRPIFEKTLYLLFVATMCVVVTTFLMVSVIPTFKQIFLDFGTTLPGLTLGVISIANWFAQYWYLFLPLVLYLVVVYLVAAFFYAQGRVWIPWPFGYLFGRSDNPTILRGLAVCVEQQMPMDEAFRRMSSHHPNRRVAKRLKDAAGTTRVGKDWCESLLDQRIITQAESAVLKSATRAGNLSWALRELSDAATRRAVYRARTLLSIAAPGCLLLIAIPVGVITLGCFIPLVSLIQNLT